MDMDIQGYIIFVVNVFVFVNGNYSRWVHGESGVAERPWVCSRRAPIAAYHIRTQLGAPLAGACHCPGLPGSHGRLIGAGAVPIP